jgi:hypothetical protein
LKELYLSFNKITKFPSSLVTALPGIILSTHGNDGCGVTFEAHFANAVRGVSDVSAANSASVSVSLRCSVAGRRWRTPSLYRLVCRAIPCVTCFAPDTFYSLDGLVDW